MDCIKNNKQGAEILMDYCAGTLDPASAASLEAHARQCAECRTTVEAQRAVWGVLDSWTPVEPSRDFDSRLYARIAGEQAGPVWRRWWSRMVQPATPHPWWKPMVSLGVAGAIVSMALIVHPPQQFSTKQGAPVEQTGAVASAPAQSIAKATAAAGPTATARATGSPEEVDLQQVEQALDDLDIVAPVNQSPASRL